MPEKARWVSRNLDEKTVEQIAPWTTVLWRKTNSIYYGTGYRAGEKPPYTGDLLLHSPYVDWYNLTWGLGINTDTPKWRWMYRARPEVRGGVDKKVILAVGKSFKVICEQDREIEGYCTSLLNVLNIREALQSAVSDMLVYGQAYFEKVRTTPDEQQEGEDVAISPEESRSYSAFSMGMSRRWNGDEFDVENPTDAIKAYAADLKAVDEWIYKNRDTLMDRANAQSSRLNRWLSRIGARKLYNYARMVAAQTVLPSISMGEPNTGIFGVPMLPKEDRDYPTGEGGPLQRRRGVNPESEKLRKEVYATPEGELIELKPIDPLFMRMNRDAFDNVLGFVQWGPEPIPQSIPMDKLVYLRWMPKSWLQENAYGTSTLMPIVRHVSMLVQAEEDMKVWAHQYAHPTLHIAVGTAEKPYPAPAITTYVNQFKNRTTNTDIVTPGDVTVTPIAQSNAARSAAQTFDILTKYLREKIYEALGVPDVLMNLPGEMTRATSDVTLQAFVAEEKMIQEMVGEQILKQVIEPEVKRHFKAKYGGDRIPVIKIMWPDVLEEDRNKRADRLAKAVGKPYETINEARAESGLEAIDDAKYDEIPEAPVGPAGGGGNNPFNPPPSKSPETNESQRTGDREETLQKRDRGNESAAAVVIPSVEQVEALRAKGKPSWQG